MEGISDAPKFLQDRPRFRIYAAQQHLDNLKRIEREHQSILSESVIISSEIEIDGFLSQLVGAVDCLLVQISDAFELNIPAVQADFSRIQSELSARTKKFDLLSELDSARQHGDWYWAILEYRNLSASRSLVSTLKEANGKHFVRRMDDPYGAPGMEIIAYFDQSLSKTEQMIENIRSRDHRLRQ